MGMVCWLMCTDIGRAACRMESDGMRLYATAAFEQLATRSMCRRTILASEKEAVAKGTGGGYDGLSEQLHEKEGSEECLGLRPQLRCRGAISRRSS